MERETVVGRLLRALARAKGDREPRYTVRRALARVGHGRRLQPRSTPPYVKRKTRYAKRK